MTWAQHCHQMSQTVPGSSDTLSGGVCTASLAGDALIILRAVWNSDHSTLTKGVFICLWAVDCRAPPPSFKVILSFVFPNCALFISYQAPWGAALCCSQQWHPRHDSQRVLLSLPATHPALPSAQSHSQLLIIVLQLMLQGENQFSYKGK